MQKLSIQEQRKIIGGAWGFKVYDDTGNLRFANYTYSTKADANKDRQDWISKHSTWTVTELSQR